MSSINRFLDVMASLRDPQKGCPWDKEQTPESIVPHTIEEAYEVAEAIEHGDVQDVRDELGDLLFQIVFYAQLYKEADYFDFEDIVDAGVDKIVRRHPHVFGDEDTLSFDEHADAWEAHKASERQDKEGQLAGALAGVSIALPALTRAIKLQKRAARTGFDWPDIWPVLDKVIEEIEEVREVLEKDAGHEQVKHEIGDLLFAVTNLARHANLDPEASLREANTRFERRFCRVEQLCNQQTGGLENSSLEQMDRFWEQAKQEE